MAGKSAIFRALRWIEKNRPLGTDFITTGKTECSVTVVIDGHTITRFRNTTKNNYIVDGLELDASGTEVPQEVSAIFNFSEVNVSMQMDPLFLLTTGSGDVAKFFNKTTRLDLIDRYTELCGAKQRKAREEQKRLTANIDSLQKNLTSLGYVEEAEHLLQEIQSIPELPILAFQDSINTYYQLQEKIAVNCCVEASLLIEEIDTIPLIQYEMLAQTISSYKMPLPSYLEDAIRLISRISAYPEPNSSLSTSISTYKQYLQNIKNLILQITHAESELPTICPTCGGVLHDSNC